MDKETHQEVYAVVHELRKISLDKRVCMLARSMYELDTEQIDSLCDLYKMSGLTDRHIDYAIEIAGDEVYLEEAEDDF